MQLLRGGVPIVVRSGALKRMTRWKLQIMVWYHTCDAEVLYCSGRVVDNGLKDAKIGLPHSRVSVKYISGNQVIYKKNGLCVQNCLKEFR